MAEGDLSAELDGGTFGFTLPLGWVQWLIFIIGALMFIGGFVIFLPGISALGALLMGFSVPTKLQRVLHTLRSQLRPADVAWKADAGGTELESFWNSATVHRPKIDHRSWVFPAPGIDDWHLAERYAPDADGELLPEHPNRIGTPRPPQFSNYGLALSIAFALLAWQIQMLLEEEGNPGFLKFLMIILASIWLIISFFLWRRAQAMQDTPTSNIRSVAVGTAELVGQVRPGITMPALTVVDGDPSKSVEGLVSWHWTYEVYRCRQVSDGEGGTKEQCSWETVRTDSGGTGFTVHDGTGGLAVHPNSFSKREYGGHLIQWECRHHFSMEGMFANLLIGGSVRRHRWTLYGLALGEPCYMLATMRTRSDDALAAESIDRSLQNALLEAVGEKAPGFKPRLEKGTELTALAGARSQLEYLIIPVVALLASILMLGL